MKRVFFPVVLILLLIGPIVKSIAADLPEHPLVLSPYLGVHLFGTHRHFDNTAEAGLRWQTDLTRPWSVELGAGILSTENRNGKSRGGLTYALNAHYRLPSDDKKIAPFVILGLGGDTLPGGLFGPDIGFGIRYFLHRDLSLRADVRYLFLFEGRDDLIATVGLSYYLSRRPAVPPLSPKPSIPPSPPSPPVPPPVPESDSDNDGVRDSADRCPDTPAGVSVDAAGCPADADHDGVSDALDKCPATPEGIKVDTAGCPLDTDRDGVPDSLDKCPNTMSGAKVNTDGCVVSITLNIKFDMGSSKIRPESFRGIERFAIFMGENPSLKVEIQGHTDNVGPEDENLVLSEARARSVRNLLIEKFGISAERLTAKGYGQKHPVATNETAEGRAQNRRVEAVIQ